MSPTIITDIPYIVKSKIDRRYYRNDFNNIDELINIREFINPVDNNIDYDEKEYDIIILMIEYFCFTGQSFISYIILFSSTLAIFTFIIIICS
jgi:hypothetical protein